MSGSRIDCLNGLRGIAALWVIVGHAHILSGFHVPIIGDPDLGVDLFVLLSGFLMVFQFNLKKEQEPWMATSTWKAFWIRRFFRIAPLYYVMLAMALMAGPYLFDARTVIDSFRGAEPQAASRYLDSGITNVSLHLTFLFGLLPPYAFRTPLPDWSIGLEMQFYAVLPFIMVLVAKVGWLRGLASVIVGALVLNLVMARIGITYPMPSFLPLKIHVFAAGMALAAVLKMDRSAALFACACAAGLMLLPFGGHHTFMHSVVRVSTVLVFFSLVHGYHWNVLQRGVFGFANWLLSSRFCKYLGELSFGAYLTHLLIMQPVVAWLITNATMGRTELWFWSLVITTPVVYGLALFGYLLIELPGQALGKWFVMRSRRVPAPL